jgi:hypothetical protein
MEKVNGIGNHHVKSHIFRDTWIKIPVIMQEKTSVVGQNYHGLTFS